MKKRPRPIKAKEQPVVFVISDSDDDDDNDDHDQWVRPGHLPSSLNARYPIPSYSSRPCTVFARPSFNRLPQDSPMQQVSREGGVKVKKEVEQKIGKKSSLGQGGGQGGDSMGKKKKIQPNGASPSGPSKEKEQKVRNRRSHIAASRSPVP